MLYYLCCCVIIFETLSLELLKYMWMTVHAAVGEKLY